MTIPQKLRALSMFIHDCVAEKTEGEARSNALAQVRLCLDAADAIEFFRDLACNFTIDGQGACGHVYLRHNPRPCDGSLDRGHLGRKK